MIYSLLIAQETSMEAAGQAKMTLIDLAVKGGWVMIPIILLSFVAAYIYIERYCNKKGQPRRPEFHEQDKGLHS